MCQPYIESATALSDNKCALRDKDFTDLVLMYLMCMIHKHKLLKSRHI